MDSRAVVTPPRVAGPIRLAPFRNLMLSPDRIGDPASARAFARPYRAVPARLEAWVEQGRLLHDGEPALYLHEYTSGGLTVRGLVGLLELTRRASVPSQWAVLPHEGIHPVQVQDLADRMTQMSLNPAPILLVHAGSPSVRGVVHQVCERAPTHDFTDRVGQRHRIWAIRDADHLAEIDRGLAPATVLIADGHHRYTAYLTMQEQRPGSPADRGLAMLIDQVDTPLFLGAIHRVLAGTSLDDLAAAAERAGTIISWGPQQHSIDRLDPSTLVITDGDRWGSMRLDIPMDTPVVQAVHDSLLPHLSTPPVVVYHHSVEASLAELRPGRDSALLLPSPAFDAVLHASASGHLLPEKATSFQPKPSLGVFMRSLLDG